MDCRDWRAVRDYFRYEYIKKRKYKEFECFLKEKIHLSNCIYDKTNIAETNKCYQTFIVGSDLVWDDSINNSDRTYMLDFASDDKCKLAYASSVGKLWDPAKNDVPDLLNRFDAIGVREREIADALNGMLDIHVDFVGDPTILLTRDEWEEMTEDEIIPGKYVLVYFSDKNQQIYQDAKRYGEEHNIPVYAISYGWLPRGIKPIRPTRIGEFLSLIKNAETVFSASYHGMLFSIYFNKQFYYYNRGWKSRMVSIAEYLDISDREHYDDKKNKLIDYNRVNVLVDKLRNESIAKLKEYLRKQEGFIA